MGYTLIITGSAFSILSMFANNIAISVIPAQIDEQLLNALLSVPQSTGLLVGIMAFIIGLVVVAASVVATSVNKKKED